jgi:hypothetical protein
MRITEEYFDENINKSSINTTQDSRIIYANKRDIFKNLKEKNVYIGMSYSEFLKEVRNIGRVYYYNIWHNLCCTNKEKTWQYLDTHLDEWIDYSPWDNDIWDEYFKNDFKAKTVATGIIRGRIYSKFESNIPSYLQPDIPCYDAPYFAKDIKTEEYRRVRYVFESDLDIRDIRDIHIKCSQND